VFAAMTDALARDTGGLAADAVLGELDRALGVAVQSRSRAA